MSGWSKHKGLAVCLALDNVDTDQIIPARFMSQPRKDGYQEFLFHDIRRNTDTTMEPSFPLNRHANATVLLCGKNFGSGSSREAAAYALHDAGIRVVVSDSFGDIFSSNAVNNGLLPAQVSMADWRKLADSVGDNAIECEIDLQSENLSIGEHIVGFNIDTAWKTKLINGWDDIDLTLSRTDEIKQYREQRSRNIPWAWPVQQFVTAGKRSESGRSHQCGTRVSRNLNLYKKLSKLCR